MHSPNIGNGEHYNARENVNSSEVSEHALNDIDLTEKPSMINVVEIICNPFAASPSLEMYNPPHNTDVNETSQSSVTHDPLDTDADASNILKNIKFKNINRLVIGQLNINSIKGKFDMLKEVIKNYIDILIINESKLDESFPQHQFCIEGYKIPYRKDCTKNSGGVLIFVREDLRCKELQTINNSGEGIFLELNLRKKKWLIFGGYNHKKSNINFFLGEVSNTLERYLPLYDNFILLGDLNSEISEESMREFCDIYNLNNLIKDPTCFSNPVKPSKIDIILTNKYQSFQNSQVVETGLYDCHKMTITVLRVFVKKQAPVCISYRDYKNYDSLIFHDELKEKLQDVDPENVNYQTFKLMLMETLNKNPKVKKKYVRANNAPFMTKTLSKAIMNRSRFKNQFNKNPNIETELNYKKQRNYCVNLLKREK